MVTVMVMVIWFAASVPTIGTGTIGNVVTYWYHRYRYQRQYLRSVSTQRQYLRYHRPEGTTGTGTVGTDAAQVN